MEQSTLYFGSENNSIGVDTSDIDLNSKYATDEILRRSNLDWEVRTQDGLGDDWEYPNSTPRLSYRMATGEDGNPKKVLLGVATTQRKVFQNFDIIKSIATFCQQSNLPILRVGSCDPYGVRNFAICGLGKDFFLNEEDQVKSQILVTHSHNKGSLNFGLITERLICTNQLSLPKWLNKLAINHLSEFNEGRAIYYLQQLNRGVNLYQEQASKLAETPIRDLDNSQEQRAKAWVVDSLGDVNKKISEQPIYVQQLLEDSDKIAKTIALKTVFNNGSKVVAPEEGLTKDDADLDNLPKAFREIMDSYYTAPGSELSTAFHTSWGALNACTHYYTHQTSWRNQAQGHFSSLWIGSKAKACQTALKESVAVSEMLS